MLTIEERGDIITKLSRKAAAEPVIEKRTTREERTFIVEIQCSEELAIL